MLKVVELEGTRVERPLFFTTALCSRDVPWGPALVKPLCMPPLEGDETRPVTSSSCSIDAQSSLCSMYSVPCR